MTDQLDRLKAALADRYKIERQLGVGGMATVYLAEDLKHHRKVAVKVLRPELAAVLGAERFVQEITTTANLQHPHILPLFDSGEAVGFLYYVMPFIDGETLRDKLNRETQLGIEEAIRITTDVADALDHAHRHNVIHRDIKPENILLQDGRPMVADFGIALAVSAAAGGRMTETGLSLGTPHYMSPEQATAEKDLTNRSDIYSLGAVLYEMLTGEPPHTGASAQAVVMKIVTDDARPVTELRKSVPPHVAAALSKSLEKLPADRFPSAAKFAEAISDPGFTLPSARIGDLERQPASDATRTSRILMGVVAVLTATTIWGLWPERETSKPITRLRLGFPSDTGITQYPFGRTVTLSPDGSQFVFVGPTSGNAIQLWLRPLDRLDATPIPGTTGGFNPSFSPDGQAIAYQWGQGLGKLRVVSLAGAPPVTLTDSSQWLGGDWGPDDYIYFTNSEWGLSRIPAGGGPVETVTAVNSAAGHGVHLWPDVLPNGKGVIFVHGPALNPTAAQNAIAVLNLETGQHETLLRGTYARYTSSGHIVYATSDGSLHAVSFDAERLEVTSTAVRILEGISIKQFGAVDLTVSKNGSLLYSSGTGAPADQLVWVSRDGSSTVIDPDWTGDFTGLSLSPDDQFLAVTLIDGGGQAVWVKELDRGPQSKLTFSTGVNMRPTWSPDGQSVLFVSDRAENRDLWERRADGSAEAYRVQDNKDHIDQGTYSPDGEWLVFRVGIGPRDIVGVRIGVDTVPQPLVADAGYDEYNPQLSPDGRWLAYVSDESGNTEVYVRPFPNTTETRRIVSNGGGRSPLWGPDGDELFYIDDQQNLVAAQIDPGATFRVRERVTLFDTRGFDRRAFQTAHDVTSDGQRFVFIHPTDNSGASNLVLVQNWFEELKERVGN